MHLIYLRFLSCDTLLFLQGMPALNTFNCCARKMMDCKACRRRAAQVPDKGWRGKAGQVRGKSGKGGGG